jgi:hypothetical protein
MLSTLKGELSSIGKCGEKSPDGDSDTVTRKVVVKILSISFSFTGFTRMLFSF